MGKISNSVLIKKWCFKHVSENGSLETGGSIIINKGLYFSETENCNLEFCNCKKGSWFTYNFGLNKKSGTVSGITYYFESDKSMQEIIRLN